jgi:FMN reductase
MKSKPLIIGLGGTPNPKSSTERALRIALEAAERAGADTRIFGGGQIVSLPHYSTEPFERLSSARELIELVRAADGLILASPSYHGAPSGLIKNALDYLQETSVDHRPYLDGVPVGLIVTAGGAQAIGSTLAAMRATVHALRGWPTPLGAAIIDPASLEPTGLATLSSTRRQVELVGEQVAAFALQQYSNQNANRILSN